MDFFYLVVPNCCLKFIEYSIVLLRREHLWRFCMVIFFLYFLFKMTFFLSLKKLRGFLLNFVLSLLFVYITIVHVNLLISLFLYEAIHSTNLLSYLLWPILLLIQSILVRFTFDLILFFQKILYKYNI